MKNHQYPPNNKNRRLQVLLISRQKHQKVLQNQARRKHIPLLLDKLEEKSPLDLSRDHENCDDIKKIRNHHDMPAQHQSHLHRNVRKFSREHNQRNEQRCVDENKAENASRFFAHYQSDEGDERTLK
jgi:hypothetical protein